MNLSTQWLPKIPTGWQIANPKSLFSERNQKSTVNDIHLTPSQKYGVLPQSEYMEITSGSVVLNLTGSDNMKHVEKNDFIIHLRSFQGGIEHSNYSGKVSNAYCVLRPNREIEPRFFRWVLKSQGYIQELNATTDQLRDGQSIKFEQFASIGLPLPPIGEQCRIADFLSVEIGKVDLIIEKNIKLLALLEKELQSHTSQVFRSISSKCKFKYRYSAKSGNSISEQFIADNSLTNTNGLPFIATKEITNDGHINYDSDIKIPLSISHLFRIAKPGTIFLCSEGGSAGKKFAINEEIVTYGNKLFSIESKSSMTTKILFHIFRTDAFQIQFSSNMNGLIGGISSNLLGEIEIPDISGDEEMVLLQDLETINSDYLSRFEKISRIIELLREYKIALTANAVTGENAFNREREVIL